MKKEDIQNAQQGKGSAENRNENQNEQKNQFSHPEQGQKEDIAHRAGLGRDRMTDIESLDGMSGRDDYAGADSDDMNDQNTSERTER